MITDAACKCNNESLALLRERVLTRGVEQMVTLRQSTCFDTPSRGHKITSNEGRTGKFPGTDTDGIDVFDEVPAAPEKAHTLNQSRVWGLDEGST